VADASPVALARAASVRAVHRVLCALGQQARFRGPIVGAGGADPAAKQC
jgi:hypothetical protein